MKKELDVVNIDNKNYLVINKVTSNDNTFLYLSNIEDEDDTLIRKIDKNDSSQAIPLENDKEFEIACNLLIKNIAS